jgi:hypothetical protein
LNPHALAGTSPSSWRVCLFRHSDVVLPPGWSPGRSTAMLVAAPGAPPAVMLRCPYPDPEEAEGFAKYAQLSAFDNRPAS